MVYNEDFSSLTSIKEESNYRITVYFIAKYGEEVPLQKSLLIVLGHSLSKGNMFNSNPSRKSKHGRYNTSDVEHRKLLAHWRPVSWKYIFFVSVMWENHWICKKNKTSNTDIILRPPPINHVSLLPRLFGPQLFAFQEHYQEPACNRSRE